jgi:hypothetical protein
MSWLNHPDIWKISLVLFLINTVALVVCVADNNMPGMIINAIFFVFNGTAALGNYLLRHYRRQERRQFLIDTTIGTD